MATHMVSRASSLPRRTDKILEAVTAELRHRQSTLNSDDAIRSVTVTVKMKNGTDTPRCVILSVESERDL